MDIYIYVYFFFLKKKKKLKWLLFTPFSHDLLSSGWLNHFNEPLVRADSELTDDNAIASSLFFFFRN